MADREQVVGGTNIRSRFRDLEPLTTEADPNKSFAQYFSLAPATPLGHFEFDADTTPAGLPSLPADCKRVVLYAMTNDFVYTDDGSAPSDSHGIPIPAQTHFIYDTDPSEDFQVYSAEGTEIRVAYYG